MKSLFFRHGGSHGGHGVHGGSGALGPLGALSGHGSHGGHGGHGGHGAMGAGMTGMAGMALSSYLNERQRRKAAKHSGKAGTYLQFTYLCVAFRNPIQTGKKSSSSNSIFLIIKCKKSSVDRLRHDG